MKPIEINHDITESILRKTHMQLLQIIEDDECSESDNEKMAKELEEE